MAVYRFGPYQLDTGRLSLSEAGTRIALRPKSFDVLLALIRSRGHVISKDDLIRAVWKGIAVGDDSLTQCIHDIRRALKDDEGRYIRTVPRRGYEFVAEVEEIDAPPDPVPARFHPGIGQVLLGVAAAIGLLALVGGTIWTAGMADGTAADGIRRLSIAVLPFEDLGEDAGWLGYGFAEDTLTELTRFRDLTVLGFRSSSRLEGEAGHADAEGRLGADYLLAGSVRRDGDRLRISARLVDGRTGVTHGAETYDRSFDDVFALQGEVADAVAARLAVHAREASATPLRDRDPARLDAYELAIRGRKAYRTFTREGMIEAQTLAERATALDPDYAPAWEVVAASLLQFYLQPFDARYRQVETLSAARSAAATAVAADPVYATGQAMLAAILLPSRDYDAALEAASTAVKLNPQDSVAQGVYANVNTFTGNYREAIAAWERAARLDPFVPALNNALRAVPHALLGEYDEALALTRSCAQQPQSPPPCLLYLAVSATALGHEEEARQAVERALAANPAFSIAEYRRATLFRTGTELAGVVDLMRKAGFPE